ncbi:MAG: alpha-L-fucosidase [Kiritimatiellaeota bacterium]|nr:alpha-L-fucosidase [Kiritimatiellota bacterium]
MKRLLCRILVTVLILLVSVPMARAAAPANPDPYAHETPAQRGARMQWWRAAKFGMFIHWGVYAVPAGVYEGKDINFAGEWIMNRGKIPCQVYQRYAQQFNPAKYDPDAWVRLAKEAGMKYIVITSKHHDGFALFDSAVTDWDIARTPYKKDLLAPLAAACRKHGIKLGFYYSQDQDWNHKGGDGNNWDPAQKGDMDEYIRKIAVPQVREILTKYGPGIPAVLWWDTPYAMNRQRAEPLAALLRLQPGIIHNDRLGGGFAGDTETPEQEIPATGIPGRDWETCMTMNGTWGFRLHDQNWKSTESLIRMLVDIASKGGNYLLNVGPTADGEIPPASVERLKQMGAWLKVNGEAIYGTHASPFAKLPFDGRCTQKPGKLFLHIFARPADGHIALPIANTITRAYLLADRNAALKVADKTIALPDQLPDPVATVVAVEITGEPNVVGVSAPAKERGG